jgi:hypothetical protein
VAGQLDNGIGNTLVLVPDLRSEGWKWSELFSRLASRADAAIVTVRQS